MYQLDATVRGLKIKTATDSEAKAKELIENALAAYGIPFPPSLRDSKQSTFADRLATTGSYFHAEADVSIIVKRAT